MQQEIFNQSPMIKLLDAAILTLAFVFNAIVLDADVKNILIAVGGSLSGSMILAYFRRDARKAEQFFKITCSAIGGLVLGTVLQEYFALDKQAYKLGLFFITSMLALVIMRSMLNLTERNAGELIKDIFQRIFNLQLKEERTRRRVERLEKESEEEKEKGR